ncbi:hypothetical protein K438DRAFT_1786995 [Mycena galopus ATCC 62051]|nr:hypothetical protein K438DRAFT_1786995 [Mycena galopus ATCC 62051]
MLSSMGVQFLQPLMDGADSENFKVCRTIPSLEPGWTSPPSFEISQFQASRRHANSVGCGLAARTSTSSPIRYMISTQLAFSLQLILNSSQNGAKCIGDPRHYRLELLVPVLIFPGWCKSIHGCSKNCNGDLKTRPYVIYKTIQAAVDYARPKYANFGIFHKKDALADNRKPRDLVNDIEPLTLLMDRRLKRGDLRWIDFKLQRMYDGCKNILCIHKPDFATGSQEFDVTLADRSPSATPKVYQITLNLVAEINPEGKLSQDNTVLTVIMAFNVVIRMQPSLSRRHLHRHGVQGFDLGPPLRLWLDIIKKDNPLPPTHSLREQLRLQRLISSIRILTTHNKSPQFPYVIRAEIGSGALIPLELCVRQFGMDVNCAMRPLKTPGDGACNMVDKKFFKAVAIERWVVVVYEQQRRFNDKSVQDVICIKLAPTPCVDIDRWRSRRQPGPPPNRPEAHHLLSRRRFRGSIQAGFGASFVRTMWSGNPLKVFVRASLSRAVYAKIDSLRRSEARLLSPFIRYEGRLTLALSIQSRALCFVLSDVLADLRVNVTLEGSEKVLWFRERFPEDEEIIEHLGHNETRRILDDGPAAERVIHSHPLAHLPARRLHPSTPKLAPPARRAAV